MKQRGYPETLLEDYMVEASPEAQRQQV